MTIEQLIEKLQEIAVEHPGVEVYSTFGYDSERCEPTPEYMDWGNPKNPDKGVYL